MLNTVAVKDIMSVPSAKRINGEKAIKICGIWAYIQYADGMIIYRYDKNKDEWRIYDSILCVNN